MNLETKLKLLAGKPLNVEGLGQVKPLTLSQISEIGYESYGRYLGFIMTDLKTLDIYQDMDEDMRKDLSFLDLCFILFEQDNSLLFEFCNAMKLLTGYEVTGLSVETRTINFENGYIGNNFSEFQTVMRLQNCLQESNKKEEFNPINDKARELVEKLKRNRKKLEEAKSSSGKEIDIHDIISSVSSRSSSLNKLNIWELTIYQLYDEFNRLQLIDDYYLNIKSIMAGATDIKLKHWSTKI